MMLFALKRRRLYLRESSQQFNNTTGLMLDDKQPPSTSFCISQSSTDMKLSIAGDPIGMYLNTVMINTIIMWSMGLYTKYIPIHISVLFDI